MSIAVLTAMECEYRAVKLLLDQFGPTRLDEYGYQKGQIPGLGGVHQVLLPPFAYGRDAAASSATSILVRYPTTNYLVFVGVAGGVPPSKGGDLVISQSVVDIEFAKLNPDGTVKQRGELLRPSGRLLDYVKALQGNIVSDKAPWQSEVRKLLTSDNANLSEKWLSLLQKNVPAILIGNIGTSMKNVNDPRIRDKWAKSEYRIRAFEMEGGGIAETANRFDKGYILIRGISDPADGNRDDEVLQPYASRIAASFLGALFACIPSSLETVDAVRTGSPIPAKIGALSHIIVDWGDAPVDQAFRGRSAELKRLNGWISSAHEHCRLVAVLGMGGMGKTSVAMQTAKELKGDFQYVIWRSLQNAPTLEEIIKDCVDIISNHEITELPNDVTKQTLVLIDMLRAKRCLIVLDNFETVLRGGRPEEGYVEGYEAYGDFLRQLGKMRHNSCILLTSREKPSEMSSIEGEDLPIRSLALSGLDVASIREIVKDKALQGTEPDWKELVENRYNGNPLVLKIVSDYVREIFNGKIRSFLESGQTAVGDFRKLLDAQFKRLSEIEQQILNWLVIERDPVTLAALKKSLIYPASDAEIVEALAAMRRRYFVEPTQGGFSLQNLILEYFTGELVRKTSAELLAGAPALLNTHCLLDSQSKEYARIVQKRMIVKPLVERLSASLSQDDIMNKLRAVLSVSKHEGLKRPGYVASNVIGIVSTLGEEFQSLDFANLAVWKADMQELELHDVNFKNCHFRDTVFADTFGSVPAVSFFPKGNRMVAGTYDGEVRIWQTSDGKQLLKFLGHDNWVSSVSVSPNEEIFATASNDHTIKLWKSETGENLGTLKGHTGPVRSIAFGHDGRILASAGEDSTVRLWNPQTLDCTGVLKGHHGRLKCLCFSPNSNLLASGGDDSAIRLWNVDTSECVTVLQGHEDKVRDLAFGPDGRLLASGSYDGTVKIWDMQTNECKLTIRADVDKVWAVAFDASGTILASGGNDGTIRIWSSDDGHLLRVLQGHTSWVRSLQFGPESGLILSGSEDQTVRLWDGRTGHCLRVFRGYTGRVFSVSYGPSPDSLISGAGDHKVRIWKISDGLCTGVLRGHKDQIFSIAFSPNKRIIASGSDDRTIRLWDFDEMQCLATLEGHEGWIAAVAFNDDGGLLASGSDDRTIRLWNTNSGQLVKVLRGHEGRVSTLAFLRNGTGLVSGSDDGSIRVWNVERGECVHVLRGHVGLVYSVACSPSSSLLASGGYDGTIRMWDAELGKDLGVFGEHSMQVWSVAFSYDGKLLASGGDDRKVKLWETETRRCVGVFEGHPQKIWTVAIGPDSRTIASGSEDQSIRIWDISTKQCSRTMRGDRLYERMNIAGSTGLTDAQRNTLRSLGAKETAVTKEDVKGEHTSTLAPESPTTLQSQKGNVSREAELQRRIWNASEVETLLGSKGFELGIGKKIGKHTFDALGSKKAKSILDLRQRKEVVCKIFEDEISVEDFGNLRRDLDDAWAYNHFHYALILCQKHVPPEIRKQVEVETTHDPKMKYELWIIDTRKQLEEFDIR